MTLCVHVQSSSEAYHASESELSRPVAKCRAIGAAKIARPLSCPSWQWHRIGSRWFPGQFESYLWHPCGVTWDSFRTVVVIKYRRTSALGMSCPRIKLRRISAFQVGGVFGLRRSRSGPRRRHGRQSKRFQVKTLAGDRRRAVLMSRSSWPTTRRRPAADKECGPAAAARRRNSFHRVFSGRQCQCSPSRIGSFEPGPRRPGASSECEAQARSLTVSLAGCRVARAAPHGLLQGARRALSFRGRCFGAGPGRLSAPVSD